MLYFYRSDITSTSHRVLNYTVKDRQKTAVLRLETIGGL